MKRASPFILDDEPKAKQAKTLYPILIEPEGFPVQWTEEEVANILHFTYGSAMFDDHPPLVSLDLIQSALDCEPTKYITGTIFYRGFLLYYYTHYRVWAAKQFRSEDMVYHDHMVDLAISEAVMIDRNVSQTKEGFNEWVYLLLTSNIAMTTKQMFSIYFIEKCSESWESYVKNEIEQDAEKND